jgi:protein O-GlcNAc transferase
MLHGSFLPRNAECVLRAVIHVLQRAKQELDRSSTLEPDNADVAASLGRYFRRVQQTEDALAAYDRAISVRPDRASFHVGRGAVLLDLKRYQEALAGGDRAVELGDASNRQVVRAYAFVGQKQFGEARKAALLALDADPSNARAQELLKALAPIARGG